MNGILGWYPSLNTYKKESYPHAKKKHVKLGLTLPIIPTLEDGCIKRLLHTLAHVLGKKGGWTCNT